MPGRVSPQSISGLFRFVIKILGVGFLFSPSNALAESQIYLTHEPWSVGTAAAIERVDSDGSDNTEIHNSAGLGAPIGIAIDVAGSKMYWTERAGKIRRSNLDGASKVDLITAGLNLPWGIALDVAGGKMYWAELSGNIIKRANLDGTNVETIVSGLNNPAYLALDLANSRIYFSQYSTGLIRRVNIDGTGLTTLVSGLNTPEGVAIDVAGNRLYWAEAGAAKIVRSNLDGSGVTDVVTGLGSSQYGIVLNATASTIYFIEFGGLVRKVNTDGSGLTTILAGDANGRDLAFYEDSDNDGIPEISDNCPTTSNVSQTDTDSDSSGDACDSDDDGDSVADGSDNCTLVVNSTQTDTDSDASGDACDADDDGDGVADGSDNCSLASNVSQTDTDSDSQGDSCDSDDDGDSVADGSDNCTLVANSAQTDTDSDSTGDACDTDDDNDTVADGADNCPIAANSNQRNTDGDVQGNACDSDDDNDGTSDSQEASDGTDPRDNGSQTFALRSNFCSEWNGFLDLWNVSEFVNLTNSTRSVESTLYSFEGVAQSSSSVTVLPGAQQDVLVHNFVGFTSDSYGKVCSRVVSGSAGDIDGRMVVYRPSSQGTEFAFSMSFSNGFSGKVFVPFNTYQPSLNGADTSNPVANWISILNLDEDNSKSGDLYYYADDGSTLGTESVTIPASARQDFSGHQFGVNKVGIVEWRPDSERAKFQVRNVRYLYDNPSFGNSFDGAFQLEGIRGSNQTIIAPLDTREGSSIIEVGNTKNTSVTIHLTIYDASGNELSTQIIILAARATVHVIADSILSSAIGSVSIAAQGSGKIIAVVMQYARTASLGINYLYGIYAKEALGNELRGTYNNFLDQGCRLLMVNKISTAQDILVSMVRSDGTTVLDEVTLPLASHGTVEYDACANDSSSTLGVVTVEPENNNSIVAHIIRYGANSDYRFPTPVR